MDGASAGWSGRCVSIGETICGHLEEMLVIPDEQKLEAFDALLFDWLGGEDVVRMVYQRHELGWSYRQIAEVHGEAVASVWRLVGAARVKLRRLKLMPADWEQPPIIDDDRAQSPAAPTA